MSFVGGYLNACELYSYKKNIERRSVGNPLERKRFSEHVESRYDVGGRTWPTRLPGTRSVVQLQRELNLSRIGGRISSRINLAKIRALEVERARTDNPVTGKSRGVEVWMIEDVEEFRAELQTEAVGETEILAKREIQPAEARSSNLRRAASQSSQAGQGNTPKWLVEHRNGCID